MFDQMWCTKVKCSFCENTVTTLKSHTPVYCSALFIFEIRIKIVHPELSIAECSLLIEICFDWINRNEVELQAFEVIN